MFCIGVVQNLSFFFFNCPCFFWNDSLLTPVLVVQQGNFSYRALQGRFLLHSTSPLVITVTLSRLKSQWDFSLQIQFIVLIHFNYIRNFQDQNGKQMNPHWLTSLCRLQLLQLNWPFLFQRYNLTTYLFMTELWNGIVCTQTLYNSGICTKSCMIDLDIGQKSLSLSFS